MSSAGRIIVYGGCGALGRACVETFKTRGWWVCNVDLGSNDRADANVHVPVDADLPSQADQVASGVRSASVERVDAIVCVAGGWAGGNASSADFVKNTDLVLKQSVWTSVIAARLAGESLKDGGFLLLTGAAPALDGTPGMIGYGLAKAAVHHLTKSLSADKSGLPPDAGVAAILPVTLDTPMNRKFMPNADHSTWTSLDVLSQKIIGWAATPSERPKKGALVKVVTKDGATEFSEV